MKILKKTTIVFSLILVLSVLLCSFDVSAALAPGSSGSSVTAMQKKLISLGYMTSSAGGSYNTATRDAVRTFESLNGLTPDGVADDEMLEKLDSVYNGSARITVNTSSLNVRKGAGTGYARLGTVKKGAVYVVIGSKKSSSGSTWYNFMYGTKSGWVSGNYVRYTAAASNITTAKTATITASSLNVRSGAGTKYSKVTTLKKGAVVTVTGAKTVSGTTWYSYTANGKTCWFCGSYAKIRSYIAEKKGSAAAATTTAASAAATTTTTTAATTTTTTATAASSSASTTASTTAATTASTAAPSPDSEAQKTMTKVQFATVKASSLNLRKGAGTSYAKVAAASKGTKCAVLGSKTVSGVKWYNILYKGKSVWACGSYLTISTKTSVVPLVDMSSYITDTPRHLSRTAVINDAAAILYSDANPSSTPVLILRSGITYTVCGSKDYKDTTWYKLNVDGIEGYVSRHSVAITNSYTPVADRDFSEKAPVIYLSPSKQGGNPYIIGNTSEKAEMEALADVIYEKLQAYDCVVHIAPKTYELSARAEHAFSLGADIYIAIHSNATGSSVIHYGPSAYYFPGCAQSKLYAQSIVASLNKVAPKGENLSVQVINGMNLAGGFGYAEVREPGTLGMIGVLVETDFHDYKPTATWLINEKDVIADAYVESLINAFGLKLKTADEPSEDIPVITPSDADSPSDTDISDSVISSSDTVISATDTVISTTDTVSTTDIISASDIISTSDVLSHSDAA